jgi:hypothetical protein
MMNDQWQRLEHFIDVDFHSPAFDENPAKEVPYSYKRHLELLRKTNGFYAFNRGLHFFGVCREPDWHNIVFWNTKEAWRKDYGRSIREIYFFAEDYFGGQYGYLKDRIVHLEPETGYIQEVAHSLSDWVEMILGNPDENLLLGLLRKWQAAGNQLEFGKHLFPKTPFVLGGSDDLADIKMVSSLDNMRFKAHLASQISRYPDGTQVEVVVLPTQNNSE